MDGENMGHHSIVEPSPVATWLTSVFWKRFSVFLSIGLSVASLILSAYANLKGGDADTLKTLTVSGIIVNSISISLSAISSLDWKRKTTTDREFAQKLFKIAHVHQDGDIIITWRPPKSSN